MPEFEYHGRNAEGKPIKGIVVASNESTVALELVRNGIVPISIELKFKGKSFWGRAESFLTATPPSVKDLTFFSRQLYTLIKAGVPMLRSVNVVLESAKNERLKEALSNILSYMESGQSFAFGLRQHPKVFPALMISLVVVGENTGALDEIFRQLSVHFSRDDKTGRQIKAALRYPIIVLVVISAAVTLVNVLVIPAFTKFFNQFKVDLPLPTRLLMASSDFFVNYWYVLAIGMAAIIVLFVQYTASRVGRPRWDHFKLKIPLFGPIMHLALMARFARSFALTSRTGVPLLEAITLISKTTDNVYMGDKIVSMCEYIKRGESITAAATRIGIFTPLILQMLSIGEETGELDKLLDQVADSYEEEVDYNVARLADSMEPILLVCVAVLVLILALGIFLPMWDLWKIAGKAG